MGCCPSAVKVTDGYLPVNSSTYSSSGGTRSHYADGMGTKLKKLDFDCVNSVAKNPDMEMYVLEILRFPFTTNVATPTQIEIVSKNFDSILAGKVAKFHSTKSLKNQDSAKIGSECMSWFVQQFSSRLQEASPSAMILFPDTRAAQVKVVRGMITATIYVVSNMPLPPSAPSKNGSDFDESMPSGSTRDANRKSSNNNTQNGSRLPRNIRGGLPSPNAAGDGWRRLTAPNLSMSDPHGATSGGSGSDRGHVVASLARNKDSSSPLPLEHLLMHEQGDTKSQDSSNGIGGNTEGGVSKSAGQGTGCPFAAPKLDSAAGCPMAFDSSVKRTTNGDISVGVYDSAHESTSMPPCQNIENISCENKDSSHSMGNSCEFMERKLYDMAKSHHARKIQVCDYRQMGMSLFATVQHCLGDECTRDVKHAWVCVYSTMLRLLMPYVLAFELEAAEKESVSTRSSIMCSLNRADKTELDGLRRDKSVSVVGVRGAQTSELDEHEAVMRVMSIEQRPVLSGRLDINRKHSSNANLNSIVHSFGASAMDSFFESR